MGTTTAIYLFIYCFSAHDYIYRGQQDLIQLLQNLYPTLKKVLLENFEKHGPFKAYFAIHADFFGKDEIFEYILRSGNYVYLSPANFDDFWSQSTQRIMQTFDSFLGTL